MKKIFALSTLFLVHTIYANSATLEALDLNNKEVVIGLVDNKIEVIKGKPEAKYLTIKDFGEDSELTEVCYKGSVEDVKELLSELVYAANGDGDSWAELVSITSKKGVPGFEVEAKITNEGGEHTENTHFYPCRSYK